jgi:putative CocE/NonD family hydrolase
MVFRLSWSALALPLSFSFSLIACDQRSTDHAPTASEVRAEASVAPPAPAFAPSPAQPTSPTSPDIPATFVRPMQNADYERREVMIPMRDGVKLHTVLLIPKGAKRAPIVLTRTPYDASGRAERTSSEHMLETVALADEVLATAGGFIRAFQDVRGKYGSEGDYVMTRPLRGPLNDTAVDHSTDAYDTIDWLVKNVPETNGKVGMIGSSYEGFTVLMALVHPHPALKVAVPMSPMVDGWKGDDWFHNGAFRQTNFDYVFGQTTARGSGKDIARDGYDDYESFRRAGSAGAFAHAKGFDQLGFWKKLSEHPAYDAYWQGQALDRILGAEPLTVPTMVVAAQWDQEDMFGGIAVYGVLEPKDKAGDKSFLVLGPWRHSGMNHEAQTLGPLAFDGDPGLTFRRDVLVPFLAAHLKDGAPAARTSPVLVFETGTDQWKPLHAWPLACAAGCALPMRKIYLQSGFRIGFDAPSPGAEGDTFDEYVSDPAKPVPYLPRPVRFEDRDAWRRWLLSDQRAVADRPDVLTYTSDALTAPVHIAGAPQVDLYASTSGTDSDWVVKLIDVYPDAVPSHPELGGYELGIAMDIFRGRYRGSLEHPAALPPQEPLRYQFALPSVDHVFLPGHRIMVQIQSSWFPLYDRNPQTFVENIFFAKPDDYRKAAQRVYRAGTMASGIELPVVK